MGTLIFTGSYTEPIQLGTGQVIQGTGEGISVYSLEHGANAASCGANACTTGVLKFITSVMAANPSYIAYDATRRRVYCANELAEVDGAATAAVSAYCVEIERRFEQKQEHVQTQAQNVENEFERASNADTSNADTSIADTSIADITGLRLNFLNTAQTLGEDCCHVSLSPNGEYLLASNYSGGSVCVLPLTEGGVGGATSFFRHTGKSADPLRQEAPHVHHAVCDAFGNVLVTDLGADKVALYAADWQNGRLTPTNREIAMPPGTGPRHCAFNKTGDRLYVLAELTNEIRVYAYDENGARHMQTISTLDTVNQDFAVNQNYTENLAAAIKLHPNGRLLFASNRGHDNIAAFQIDENGLLSAPNFTPSGGRSPRDFDISPCGGYLAVGNQESGDLVVFTLDERDGALAEICRAACGMVTAVLFVEIVSK